MAEFWFMIVGFRHPKVRFAYLPEFVERLTFCYLIKTSPRH